MPKIKYVNKDLGPEKLYIVKVCNHEISKYQKAGYSLTLRPLYYRLVAQNLFPDSRRYKWTGKKWVQHPEGTKNALPNYNWLSTILNDARLAGLVDWDAIVDRTRAEKRLRHWKDAETMQRYAAEKFHQDMWRWQPNRVVVWVEKEALEDVIGQACVPSMSLISVVEGTLVRQPCMKLP
jgi:hypothetical protein